MKVRVTLQMDFDIGDGDDEFIQPFEDRDEGWYQELKSKLENRLFNYSYADLLDHQWNAQELDKEPTPEEIVQQGRIDRQ